MVTPTARTKDVSSRDVLRCTARRLQAGRGDKSSNNEANNSDANNNSDNNIHRQEKVYDAVKKIWLSVGLVVENALLSTARGVRIESLGTFTLDAKGRARFFLAPDFAARYRLLKYDVCSGGCLAGGVVNCSLNVSRVAATAGSPRPKAERVVGAVLRSLHQRLAAGRHATLSFHPVAEFRCSPSRQATMKFLPGFRVKEEKVAMSATRARIGVARTRTKPSPWRTASASAIPAPPASGTHASNAAGRNDSVGRRPRSASSEPGIRLCTTSDRPETSHGSTSWKRSPAAQNGAAASVSSSTACGSAACSGAPVASSVGRRAVGSRTGAASRNPPGKVKNNGRRPATTASCASSRGSHRALSAPQGGNRSLDNNNDDDDDETEISVRGGETLPGENHALDHEPAQISSEPRAGDDARSYHRPDPRTKNQEMWLSGLLRRQTLAQAGDEGLRRLTEALKLAHASSESGGRLSGRDLLLALRSAGTMLTSAQLAATRSVFRQQPDRHVSLALILAAVGGATVPSKMRQDPSGGEGSVRRDSHAATPQEREVEVAGMTSNGAATPGASSGLPWERALCQAGVVTPALPSPPRAGGDERVSAWSSLSESPCLSESSSINRVLHWARAAEEHASGRSRHGNHKLRYKDGQKEKSSSGREESGTPRAEQVTCSAAKLSWQRRRECWVNEKDGSGGGADDASGLAVTEDAIADLARIVFHPPSSLERLLHVLQASKINEQPTMPCTALAARLVQMCPGLGKARATQLATAACRYPDKQVDLGQLHALLENRFGRSRGDTLGRNNSPRTITAVHAGEQGEAARMGGRRCPRAVGAAAAAAVSPHGEELETTTRDDLSSSDHRSGISGRSQQRTSRLAQAWEERGGDAEGNQRRGRSDELHQTHPPVQGTGGRRATSRGVEGRQQGWMSASDLPLPAAAPAADTPEPASPTKTATTRSLRSSKSAGFLVGGAPAYGRQAAAARVQSLFRGHKGRNRAAAEGRKRARRLAEEREAREEQQRPSAAACRRRGGRISRPKGRSTYGF